MHYSFETCHREATLIKAQGLSWKCHSLTELKIQTFCTKKCGSLPAHWHPQPTPAPVMLLSLCPLSTVTATGRPWQAQTLMLSLSAPHLRSPLCRNLAHRTKGNRWCTTVHAWRPFLWVGGTDGNKCANRGDEEEEGGWGEGRESNFSTKKSVKKQTLVVVPWFN